MKYTLKTNKNREVASKKVKTAAEADAAEEVDAEEEVVPHIRVAIAPRLKEVKDLKLPEVEVAEEENALKVKKEARDVVVKEEAVKEMLTLTKLKARLRLIVQKKEDRAKDSKAKLAKMPIPWIEKMELEEAEEVRTNKVVDVANGATTRMPLLKLKVMKTSLKVKIRERKKTRKNRRFPNLNPSPRKKTLEFRLMIS